MRLTTVKALLVDLEGTVRFRGDPIPGAGEALNRLRSAGFRLRFTTNIDSMRAEEICDGLRTSQAEAYPEEIFTPTTALHAFVGRNPARRWHFLVSQTVLREFDGQSGEEEQPADFVVVGDFRDRFTYDRLNAAYRHLMNGAELVALQSQPFFMGRDGYYLDTGAVVHMLEWASEKRSVVLGKPSPDYYRLALEQMGLRPEEALVIGDDVATDIKGAVAAGCPSILVRTGKFRPDSLEASAARPDLVVDSLASVPEVLDLCRT